MMDSGKNTEKFMTCIACPLGCQLKATLSGEEIVAVAGNSCKRGEMYARSEIICPTRSLTTTVRCEGGIHPVVPVRSSMPVPKDKISECMKIINATCVQAPVRIGQIIIYNILGTDANIVATNNN